MKKAERNDPCPCGSGKKYKKCCWQKDKEKHVESEHLLPESDELEIQEWDDEEWDDEDYEEEMPEHIYRELKKHSEIPFQEDNYPEISDAGHQKIDDWYDRYEELTKPTPPDPVAIKEHIISFLEKNNSDVNLNLALEHEIIFDLEALFAKQERHDEMIPVLLYLKEKHPEIYIRSAEYYDYTIITHLAAKQKFDEIPRHLGFFEKYPIHAFTKLSKLIFLFQAINRIDVLMPLVRKVYVAVFHAPELIGDANVIDIILDTTLEKYIEAGSPPENTEELFAELEQIGKAANIDLKGKDFWQAKLSFLLNTEHSQWNERKKNPEYLNEIIKDFSSYLFNQKKLGLRLPTIFVYIHAAFDFLKNNSKPFKKSIFRFSKKQLDNYIAEYSQDLFFLDSARVFSYLNAMYYFAQYLEECGNFSARQKDELQAILRKLFNESSPSLTKQDYDALCFKEFPLFG